jgi:hypothetical protein
MAGQNHLLSRIAALVAGFDDASWEALASKGLLRRARSDLAKGLPVEAGGGAGDELEIKVPPFVVSMPAAGPAQATCTCPAPGICHHILIAGLFLQAQASSSGTQAISTSPEAIRDEIGFFTPERLKAWAGAPDYRAGLALFEKNTLAPVIEFGETVLIRLMPSNIEARYLPLGGLDGMVLPRGQAKRVAVASILALRKSLGFEWPEPAAEQPSLIEVSGTPRSAKEILESAAGVFEDAIQNGLSHASPVLVDRLVTLAVSAQGASLPRVSLALKTVADEVDSMLKREARADESRLLLVMARVYALMEALRQGGDTPRLELAGVTRAGYVDVPEIELFGVGAYTWKTGSGYEGLTVLFWSNQSKEFLSWAAARPGTRRFDPRRRFYGEGPWDGTQSPQQAASSHLRLRNARRTANGRLSGSAKTSALVLAPTPIGTLDFAGRLFGSWRALEAYVRQKQPLGLCDPNPLELIVALEPASFGARRYDVISQTFAWDVCDQADEILVMSLPFRDWSQDAIRVLEALEPGANSRWRVVVRAALRDGALSVEPVSILRPETADRPVFQLAFDAAPQKAATTEGPEAVSAADDEDSAADAELPEDASPEPARMRLNQSFSELNRQLVSLAEAGCQNVERSNQENFTKWHRDFLSSGLTLLAGATIRLADPAGVVPSDVLRARYLAYLHAQAAGQIT